jgi:signal transduction histidine kinase
MLLEYFKKLTEIGVYQNQDRLDSEKILIVNFMFLATLPIFAFYFLKNLLDGDFGFAFFYVVFILLSSVVLILNKYGKYAVAKIYSIIFYTTICFGVQYLFGSGMVIESMQLVFVVITAYIVDNRFTSILIVAIITIGFSVLKYIENFQDPIFADRIMLLSPICLFIISVILIASFIYDRRNKAENYIKQYSEYEQKLKIKNEELGGQKELITEQNMKLEKKNHELNQFAYIAAHDLKSPIRSMKSFAQLAKMNLDKKNYDKVYDYLNTITTNTSHLYDLIQDLLSYSLLEKDSIELEMVDLNDIFESCKLLINDKLGKSVQLISKELPTVKVNALQFKLLFQNLIENGLKYNKSEIPEIIIEAKNSYDHHFISFTDNGIGVDNEYQEQIFEMFNRLHPSVEYEGSGLGLAICRKIMDRHKGSITIADSSERGSTFVIRWPMSLEVD